MRRLSIKTRLTLWYAAMATLIAVVLFILLDLGSNSAQTSSMGLELTRAVTYTAGEMEYEHGFIELEDDEEDLALFADVQFSVFNLQGELLLGNSYGLTLSPAQGEVRRVAGDQGQDYLVYDLPVSLEDGPQVWLRGMLSLEGMQESGRTLRQIALLALPLLVALLCGLYAALFIRWSSRSLSEPIQTLKTAMLRGQGRDLSVR